MVVFSELLCSSAVIDEYWDDFLSQLRDEYCVHIKRSFIDI